ncbi:Saccharopine dehydrogenase [Minicystis rosea]|nr:Saccharopine dehydrogenase [Minicystis rosea]
MATILILGGAGTFGRLAAADLLVRTPHDVAVAGRRGVPADAWLPGSEGRITSHTLDITDEAALRALVDRLAPAVIAHAAGPYARLGDAPLRVAIETRTPYVDMCPRSDLYVEIAARHRAAAESAGIPVVLGASTIGGLTGTLTRRAHARLQRLTRVRTYLSVHNFSWGASTVADYLLAAKQPLPAGRRLGDAPEVVRFPNLGMRRTVLGDSLEYIPGVDGLAPDTEHRFGLDTALTRLGMISAITLSRLGLPLWRFGSLLGWGAGWLGGSRTEGGLLHRAFGDGPEGTGVYETHILRPFGNIRNPVLMFALTAARMADGGFPGTGIIHPATWLDPDRLIAELRARANVVTDRFVPEGAPLETDSH